MYSLRLTIVLIIDLNDNMWLFYTTMNLVWSYMDVKCDFIHNVANKYKEYSLRVIIVFIIDIAGNMWLFLHNEF